MLFGGTRLLGYSGAAASSGSLGWLDSHSVFKLFILFMHAHSWRLNPCSRCNASHQVPDWDI
jgi:hypothetical protein